MHILTVALLLRAATAVLVPGPPGPYSVAMKTFELVDPHRRDLLAPPNNNSIRRTVASVYLPIDASYSCQLEKTLYMPPLTAKVFDQVIAASNVSLGSPNFLSQFEIEFCNISSIEQRQTAGEKSFPVAIFSGGQTASRLLYGALTRSLASLGYIVFSVDHAYEATVVEFPNGHAVYGLTLDKVNEAMYPQELGQRVADERFLISQLENKTFVDAVFEDFPGTFDPCKVAVYGHSFGGATAALMIQQESKAIGGLNFDGTLFGPVVNASVRSKPFALMASQMNYDTVPPLSGLSWDGFYRKLEAAKIETYLKNTTHLAFLDVPLLLTAAPAPASSQPMLNTAFGALNGKEIELAQNEIMGGLLDLLYRNDSTPLMNLSKNTNVDVLNSSLSFRTVPLGGY